MSTRIKVAGLIVLSLVQLGAASWSIIRYERILASGTPYKIRTEPIDPGDPFRGRYVAVRPAIVVAKPIAPETERLLQSIFRPATPSRPTSRSPLTPKGSPASPASCGSRRRPATISRSMARHPTLRPAPTSLGKAR